MADGSKIQWTDATWNIITGCTVLTPGCRDCYAMKLAGGRLRNHPSRKGLTTKIKGKSLWNGKVRFNEQWLDMPERWTRPRMVFVCAHGDLFHEAVPDAWLDLIFARMAIAHWHTYQVLTKRSARAHRYITGGAVGRVAQLVEAERVIQRLRGHDDDDRMTWPLRNVWLGVSAERQKEADERIPQLLHTPAAIRFVSLEPLLAPIDLRHISRRGANDDWTYIDNALDGFRAHKCGGHHGSKLDWVIVGGESGGPKARPMLADWPISIRDQCTQAGVPFFFKQWGTYSGLGEHVPDKGGRKLMGRTWDEMPKVSHERQTGRQS